MTGRPEALTALKPGVLAWSNTALRINEMVGTVISPEIKIQQLSHFPATG